MHTAPALIRQLGLLPHPEGGHYRETYRSAQSMVLPDRSISRNVCTGIYFLLEAGNFSAFHRIASDEMWHFYAGQTIDILEIDEAGQLQSTRLGPDIAHCDTPQHVVPAGRWFASRLSAGGAFALVGCTVAPGFDFADFELGQRAALCAAYPQHADTVCALTRC